MNGNLNYDQNLTSSTVCVPGPEQILKYEEINFEDSEKKLLKVIVRRAFCKCGQELTSPRDGTCYSIFGVKTTWHYVCPKCGAHAHLDEIYPAERWVFSEEKPVRK